MKAKDVKYTILIAYRFMEGQACCTEQQMTFGNADVYAVDKKKRTTEFEVKVNKADFLSEIQAIKVVLEIEGVRSKMLYDKWLDKEVEVKQYPNKFNKHRHYLKSAYKTNSTWGSTVSTPNRFYFVITEDIEQRLLKCYSGKTKEEVIAGAKNDFEEILDLLKSTPYGLIVHRKSEMEHSIFGFKDSHYLHFMQKAGFIHKDEIDYNELFRFSKRCSAEIISLTRHYLLKK